MIGMLLAEGNLVFVQWSAPLSDGNHILPTQHEMQKLLWDGFFWGGGWTGNLNPEKEEF